MCGPDESHTPKYLQVVAFSNLLDWVQDACWYWIAKYRKQFVRKWILLQTDQSGSHVSEIKVSWPALLTSFHSAFFRPAILTLTCGCRTEVSVKTETTAWRGDTCCIVQVFHVAEGKVRFFLKIKGFLECDLYLKTLHTHHELEPFWFIPVLGNFSLTTIQKTYAMNHSFIPLKQMGSFPSTKMSFDSNLEVLMHQLLHWVVLHLGCSPTVPACRFCHLFLSPVTGLFLFQPRRLEAQPASRVEWRGISILTGLQYGPLWP